MGCRIYFAQWVKSVLQLVGVYRQLLQRVFCAFLLNNRCLLCLHCLLCLFFRDMRERHAKMIRGIALTATGVEQQGVTKGGPPSFGGPLGGPLPLEGPPYL